MTVRMIGVLIGIGIFVFAIIGRRRGRFSRGDVLVWGAAGVVAVVLSVAPVAANLLASLFRLENRLFAVLVTSVGALVVLTLRNRTRINRVESRFGELVRNLAISQFERGTVAGDHEPTVAVVIAAFNEEEAIQGVLTDLPSQVEGHVIDPIVVVDGSSDDTAGVVTRAGYSVASHPVNRGQGDALRTGFTIALARGDEIVVTMDADGQHRPDQLSDLVKPIIIGEADYVQGSRFLGIYDDTGGSRETGIRLFTRLIRLLSGADITDCTNGYRAIRADKLTELRLEEDRFSAPEIIMEAASHGLRIREVPVHIRSRSHGHSKKPGTLRYPFGFLRAVLGVWLRQL